MKKLRCLEMIDRGERHDDPNKAEYIADGRSLCEVHVIKT